MCFSLGYASILGFRYKGGAASGAKAGVCVCATLVNVVLATFPPQQIPTHTLLNSCFLSYLVFSLEILGRWEGGRYSHYTTTLSTMTTIIIEVRIMQVGSRVCRVLDMHR